MTRIALISDIHYGKFSRTAEFSVPGENIIDENTGGESPKASMISLLKDKKIEYLCVAGDLTSLGSPQEFWCCEEMLLDLALELEIPKENILLGLGNHDIDWNISELHSKFDSCNADFPLDLVKEKYRKIAASASRINIDAISEPKIIGPAPYSGIVENDNFIMFVLNTGWCCTKDQAFSRGKLDKDQLDWFNNEAAKFKSSKKWKIILMHHHPFNYTYPVNSPDFSMLEEGSNFLEIAGNNGFQLVLHGHRHHPRAETHLINNWDSPITFICAGSFAVNSSHRSGGSIPNTFHIIELTDNIGVLKLYNYQFSPAQGWIPITQNCPETPLDRMMMLGKIFSPDDIERSIRRLADIQEELKWDELDECLRFLPFNVLNEKIRTQLVDTHKMIGQFPEEVFLFKK